MARGITTPDKQQQDQQRQPDAEPEEALDETEVKTFSVSLLLKSTKQSQGCIVHRELAETSIN